MPSSEAVTNVLNATLQQAEEPFIGGTEPDYGLSQRFQEALAQLSVSAKKASSAFTNIVTCLAIKAAMPHVDIRYHQVQIQKNTDRPAGFNFRGVSEKTIYPWLNKNTFEGAKSGWQTRTFERPKPYSMSYDENIGDVKEPFLSCFDEVGEHGQSAEQGLAYLLYHQLIQREGERIVLSIPRTQDILLIVDLLRRHFFYTYKHSKGASRLPVLALYAMYAVMLEELGRFHNMELKALEEHSAADAQTGAVGDVEIIRTVDGSVFEAIEVKHNIPISEKLILDVEQKIRAKKIDRYYVLTTHHQCEPDVETARKIASIKNLYECQIIANGVIPSLKYYLRLLADPSKVIPRYVDLLLNDAVVAHEHRMVWNELTTTMAQT